MSEELRSDLSLSCSHNTLSLSLRKRSGGTKQNQHHPTAANGTDIYDHLTGICQGLMVSCLLYLSGCVNDIIDAILPIYVVCVIVVMYCFAQQERPEVIKQYTYMTVTDTSKIRCPYISCFGDHWKMQRAIQRTQYAHCSTERSLTGTGIYERVLSFDFSKAFSTITMTRSKGGDNKSVVWKDIPIGSSLKLARRISVPRYDGPGCDTVRAAFNRDKGMLQLLFQEGEHSKEAYTGYFEGTVYIQDGITMMNMVLQFTCQKLTALCDICGPNPVRFGDNNLSNDSRCDTVAILAERIVTTANRKNRWMACIAWIMSIWEILTTHHQDSLYSDYK